VESACSDYSGSDALRDDADETRADETRADEKWQCGRGVIRLEIDSVY